MTSRRRAPARCVPVATQVRRVARHDDLVTDSGRDLVIASGTAIRLRCLVGVDVLHVDVVGVGQPMFFPQRWFTAFPSPTAQGRRRSAGLRRRSTGRRGARHGGETGCNPRRNATRARPCSTNSLVQPCSRAAAVLRTPSSFRSRLDPGPCPPNGFTVGLAYSAQPGVVPLPRRAAGRAREQRRAARIRLGLDR